MSLQSPPDGLRMTPNFQLLPAGSTLWRWHGNHRDAIEFNSRLAHPVFEGNRFDGTEFDPYSYLYLTQKPATALAEAYLRGRDFNSPYGHRLIGFDEVATRSLSAMRTTADLTLVRLVSEEDLAAVCQTSWLVDAEARDYPQTRYWAAEIRRQAPDAHGLVWTSHRHHPRRCLVLFGDRCDSKPLRYEPALSFRLGTPAGFAEANRLLAPLRAVVTPPPRRFAPRY